MVDNEKLRAALDKVTKLRNLAARAETQAEAEAAYAQAEAIIAKYQISESQIEINDPAQAETIGEDEHPLWHGEGSKKAWLGVLAAGLSRIHGCAVVSGRGVNGSYYSIAGRPSDIAIVRYLFAWLHCEIDRLADREIGKAARNAFRLGAVTGAIRAIRRSQAYASTAHGPVAAAPECTPMVATSMAMVLSNRSDDAMKFFETQRGYNVGSGRAHTKSRDRSGAYGRGREAGSNLAPRAALNGGKGTKLLGS